MNWKELEKRLAEAWELRMSRQLDACYATLGSLKSTLGIPPQLLDEPEIRRWLFAQVPGERGPFLIEVFLLEASMSRARGELTESNLLLKCLQECCLRMGLEFPYQGHLQSALNALGAGDYATALERFSRARAKSKSPAERALALTNLFFCMESLGLPLDELHSELKSCLASASLSSEVRAAINSQLRAFEMRNAFRFGRICEVVSREPSGEIDQAAYFQLWVSELPYHAADAPKGLRERFFAGAPDLYQKTFRARTLHGSSIDGELDAALDKELADRIYLWVWRWLVMPEKQGFGAVVQAVSALEARNASLRLTAEDIQEIRNALSWIGLFHAASLKSIHRILDKLKLSAAADFPIFDFEARVIQYFLLLRDGASATELSRARSELSNHSLWKSPDLGLRALVEKVEHLIEKGSTVGASSMLSCLAECVAAKIGAGSRKTSGKGERLWVLWDAERLVHSPSGREIVSKPMCEALALLEKQNPAGCEELLFASYGIRRFDSLIHSPKVSNLLFRMREFLPSDCSLKMVNAKVHFVGDWGNIDFVRPDPLTLSIQSQLGWASALWPEKDPRGEGKAPLPTASGNAPGPWIVQAREKGTLTREDLEKLIRKSKATTNRLIREWVEGGILTVEGKGKNTRYQVSRS